MLSPEIAAFALVFFRMISPQPDALLADGPMVECAPTPGGLITVDTWIGNKRFNFIVDTGTTHNIFDPATLKELDDVKITRLQGFEGFSMVEPVSVRVQHLSNARDDVAFSVDLTSLSDFVGEKIDGILGMSFLADKVVVARERRIFLADRGYQVPPRLTFVGCQPDADGRLFLDAMCISTELSDLDDFLVDTGTYLCFSLSPKCADTLRERGFLSEVKQSQQMQFEMPKLNAKFNVVPTRVYKMRLRSVHEDYSITFDVKTSDENLVGVGLLVGFNGIIDFKQNRFYFSLPFKRPAE